ncbi:MAG: M56 family metallopeptidase [Saprospiraceae bacterium]
MTIITYIIFSYILSAVGYGIYQFWVRRRVAVKHKKWAVYTVLLLSLLLPFGLIQSNPLFFTEKPHAEVEFHDEPVLTKELLACYTRTSNQEGFCHCEEVQQLNLIQYEKNTFYDTFLTYQSTVYIITGVIAISVLMVLLFKLFQLYRLVANARKEKRIIDGQTYTILHTNQSILAASFRLRKRYIIWNPSLNNLTKNEQEAVLQHEIAHINNKDTWEQIALSLIQMAWLFNPIFYVIKKELNLINEFLADAFAVEKINDVKIYANLILKLKSSQQHGLVHQLAQHPIQERIIQLFEPKQKSSFLPVWLFVIGVFMVTTSWTSASLVNQHNTKFEEYCHLQKKYKDSGRNVFCKNCLFEDLN